MENNQQDILQSEALNSEMDQTEASLDESVLINISEKMITPIKEGDFVVLQYPKDANMTGIKHLMRSLEAHMRSMDLKIPVIFVSDDFKVFVLRKEDAGAVENG